MKIVINKCYGVMSLSTKACDRLGCHPYDFCADVMRTNSDLIQVVEELGEEASGSCAKLCVVEIPDEATDYMIVEYDGRETLYYVVDGKIY